MLKEPIYPEERNLATLAHSLLRDGFSSREVRDKVQIMLWDGDIFLERSLPPDWKFEFKARGLIMIAARALYEDASHFKYYRPATRPEWIGTIRPLDPSAPIFQIYSCPPWKAPEDEEPIAPAEPVASMTPAPAAAVGKAKSVEVTEAMRQQDTLKLAITEWLLKDKTRTSAGKQVLDADSVRYRASCEKKFPGVHHNELKRGLLDARKLLGAVKERPYQKGQSRAKRPRKET